MKLSLSLLFLLLFSTVAISNNQKSDEYLLHAESSERLATIMQQLLPLVRGIRLEETTTLTEDDMADLIEAVEELLFYAELMSLKVPANELDENKSVIFRAMANQLYDETLNIQQLTKNTIFTLSIILKNS